MGLCRWPARLATQAAPRSSLRALSDTCPSVTPTPVPTPSSRELGGFVLQDRQSPASVGCCLISVFCSGETFLVTTSLLMDSPPHRLFITPFLLHLLDKLSPRTTNTTELNLSCKVSKPYYTRFHSSPTPQTSKPLSTVLRNELVRAQRLEESSSQPLTPALPSRKQIY